MSGFGIVAKDEAACDRGNRGGDGEKDVRGAIVVAHEDACSDERRCKSADAPAEVEERKQRRASLGKIAACEERDGGHGYADADAEQQEYGREQRARADGNSEAGADHCGEADGHEARIVAAAQKRAQRRAGEVEEKEQAGGGVAEVKAGRERRKQGAADGVENTGEREDRMKDGEGAAGEVLIASGIEGSGALDAVAFGIGRTGGFPNDEFGVNGNEVRKRGLAANALQQNARSRGAHLIERLANRGEAGVVKRGALDIIEAHDGNVGGNLEAVVHESANGSDGGDIVVAEERGKIGAALDKFVGGLEAKFGR